MRIGSNQTSSCEPYWADSGKIVNRQPITPSVMSNRVNCIYEIKEHFNGKLVVVKVITYIFCNIKQSRFSWFIYRKAASPRNNRFSVHQEPYLSMFFQVLLALLKKNQYMIITVNAFKSPLLMWDNYSFNAHCVPVCACVCSVCSVCSVYVRACVSTCVRACVCKCARARACVCVHALSVTGDKAMFCFLRLRFGM